MSKLDWRGPPAKQPDKQTKKGGTTPRTFCDLRGLARGGNGGWRRRSWRYRRGRSILGRGHLRRWYKAHKLLLVAAVAFVLRSLLLVLL